MTMPRMKTQTKRSFSRVFVSDTSIKFDERKSSKLFPTISSPTKPARSQILRLLGILGAVSINGKLTIVPVRL